MTSEQIKRLTWQVPVRVWVSEDMRSSGEAAPGGGPHFKSEPVVICVDKEAKVMDLQSELRLLDGVDKVDIVVVNPAPCSSCCCTLVPCTHGGT